MQRFLSYENTILAVVMMVSFINPFTSSALTTALPGIGTAYGATDAQLSWVIELFLISSTVTIMPISKIADRIGIIVMSSCLVYPYSVSRHWLCIL